MLTTEIKRTLIVKTDDELDLMIKNLNKTIKDTNIIISNAVTNMGTDLSNGLTHCTVKDTPSRRQGRRSQSMSVPSYVPVSQNPYNVSDDVTTSILEAVISDTSPKMSDLGNAVFAKTSPYSVTDIRHLVGTLASSSLIVHRSTELLTHIKAVRKTSPETRSLLVSAADLL